MGAQNARRVDDASSGAAGLANVRRRVTRFDGRYNTRLHLTAPRERSFTFSERSKQYVGEYRSDELNVSYTIVVAPDGRLAVMRNKLDPILLQALKPDTFSGASLGTLTFVRAPSGATTGSTITMGGVRRLWFARVEK